MIVYGEFSRTDFAGELAMIGVNLVALTELTKLCLPEMIGRGRGAILNVGSTGSFAPSPLNAVYSATKAYVLSFSEAIAEELAGSGITVTALCPGATRSDLQRRAGMEDVRLLQRGVMDPAEVAEAGYRALQAGRRVEVPGRSDRLQIAFSRFLPRRMIVKYAHRMLRRVE
jgi:short-subunit dehydrogenase